jgi:hypothetical protein
MLKLKLFSAGLFLFLLSCKKDRDPEPDPSINAVNVQLSFECDGLPLVKDSFLYTNDAGNNYSVNRLQFYLSDFVFRKPDGTELKIVAPVYVDFFGNRNFTFRLEGIPYGLYDRIRFCIGLPPLLNVPGGLPNTLENTSMIWPEAMGGGYHFLKLEGRFKFSGQTYGYAIHLGKNPHLVKIDSFGQFHLTSGHAPLRMRMNINEWFRNPHVYDFNTDGNYTMGSDSLMLKIAQNGTDVFTIE